jgi:hypothetical protein
MKYYLLLIIVTNNMGNTQSIPKVNTKAHEEEKNTRELCDREIQTCEPPIHSIIHIVHPNFLYKWNGPIEDSPHRKNNMSEMEWATHMENTLIEKRKSCPLVKQNNSEIIIIPPKIPSCRQPSMGTRCPGDAIPKFALQGGRPIENRRIDINRCRKDCYYKNKIEICERMRNTRNIV